MHAKMRNNDAKASDLHNDESRLNHSIREHREKATQLTLVYPGCVGAQYLCSASGCNGLLI